MPNIEALQGSARLSRQIAERTVHEASEGLDNAEGRVEYGDVGVTICEVAETEVVVLGTDDRSRWGRLWFGSVSDHVVQHAPCPVRVVR